jgi:MATE family multidrug resistance protein
MSMAAVTVMEFTDRVFLSNYSLDAISAATPAGVVALVFLAFFSGISGYASVFVAQYIGAGAKHRVGAALWQAIYFSLFSGAILAGLSLFSEEIFALGGHSPAIQKLEVIYFRILTLGGITSITAAGMAAFFTGRGVTRPVMMVNTAGMLFNIPLDYALIYGKWGLPEMGITGAAIATVASWTLMVCMYIPLLFTRANNRRYSLLSARRIETDLLRRLIKYGVPGALQFCLDIFAFLFFVFMVGRIGDVELAVTNIVISINSLAFLPAIGCSQGISTLVGQALGRGLPAKASAAMWSAIHLLLLYTIVLAMVYLLLPHHILSLFIPSTQTLAGYAPVAAHGKHLLWIVAIYMFLDVFYMSFTGALRGAGDTRFIMWAIGIASLFVAILPVYIGVEWMGFGLYYAWGCLALFVAALFGLSAWRYRQGLWRGMLVVEPAVVTAGASS